MSNNKIWLNVNTIDRFMSRVDVTNSCWLWESQKIEGYGYFSFNQKPVRAHRFLYQYIFGTLPRKLTLDHLCKVRNCVNPYHLEPVSSAENIRRSKKPFCKRGHLYQGTNLKVSKDRRYCRTCRNYQAWKRNNNNQSIDIYFRKAEVDHIKKAGVIRDD